MSSTPLPSATAPSTAPARMSSPARIVGAILSPGRTFADLAREPHFILCWVVQAVVGSTFAWCVVHRVGLYALARQAIGQNPRAMANMSPEQLQGAVSMTAKVMHWTFYLQPLLALLIMVIMGAILLGIGNFLLGYEGVFKQALAVTSHAFLTLTVSALLALGTLGMMADPSQFRLTNPIGTNLAYFLDRSSVAPFLYNLAMHIDLISIWCVVLLALGLAAMGGRKGRFGSALMAVGGLWLFYCLAASGLAAAFA